MSKKIKKTNHKKKPVKKSKDNTRRNSWILLGVVILICFIAYSQVFTFNFVSLDDTVNVIGNKQITSFSTQHIKEVFSRAYVQMYAPLTMISYMIDYFFAGKPNPEVFHFFNLLYHLINVVIVFIFIHKLTLSRHTGLIAAALFGLHTMNVETVAWISTRSSLLFVGFGLMSMIFYLKYLEKNYHLKYLLLACLFFLLSLLSKSTMILMPLLLWTIDYYKGRKISIKLLVDKIPFALLSLIFLVIIFHFRSTDIVYNKETYSILSRLLFASYGLTFYIVKFFLPVNLSVIHPFPLENTLPVVYYLSVLILPVLIFFMLRSGKLKKDVVFGLAFFVINLLLVLQILPYGYSVVSERYVYLPYLGLFLILGQIYTGIGSNVFSFSKGIKPLSLPVILLFVIILSVMTYSRTSVWKNPLSLFEDAVSKHPDNYYALYSRGVARSLFNDSQGAMNDYNKAIEQKPDYAEAFAARGSLYDALNDTALALQDYNKALSQATYLTETYYNRGNNKLRANNFKGAVSDYNIVVNADSVHDNALCNRGTAWLYLNDSVKACKDWKRAAALGNKNAINQLDKYCK